MKIAETVITSKQEVSPTDKKEQMALKKALKDFEAVFMGELMKDMRRTIPKGGLFGQNPQEDMMRDLLDEEWSQELALSGHGLGLADSLYRQMQRHT